jgi:hypothetical protein
MAFAVGDLVQLTGIWPYPDAFSAQQQANPAPFLVVGVEPLDPDQPHKVFPYSGDEQAVKIQPLGSAGPPAVGIQGIVPLTVPDNLLVAGG